MEASTITRNQRTTRHTWSGVLSLKSNSQGTALIVALIKPLA